MCIGGGTTDGIEEIEAILEQKTLFEKIFDLIAPPKRQFVLQEIGCTMGTGNVVFSDSEEAGRACFEYLMNAREYSQKK